MASIEQIRNKEIDDLIAQFSDWGGVIDFKFFKVDGAATEKEAHLLAANKTLELLEEEYTQYLVLDREEYRNSKASLDKKAFKINVQDFFGPYFSIADQRPVLLGTKGTAITGGVIVFCEFFYYDDEEAHGNKVIIERGEKSEFRTLGYADAFLFPPHSFGRTYTTNYDIGKFFIDFNHHILDDFEDISVYKWPNDCSAYFECGKEWWGSLFWTVYNPVKNWYIGIAASDSD